MASQENDTVANNAADTGGEVNEAGENAQNGQNAQARPGKWAMVKTLLVRCFFIYMISSFFRRSPTPAPATDGKGGGTPGAPVTPSSNIFVKDMLFDMYVYLNEEEFFSEFDNPKTLFWHEEDLIYGDWTGGLEGDGNFYRQGQVAISEKVQNNGSIYLHLFIVKSGKSPNPDDKSSYSKKHTIYRSKMLNKFKKRKFHTTVNLLTGTTDAHPDLIKGENETREVEILSTWHPNITINVIEDHTPWTRGSVPAPLDEAIEFIPGTSQYKPIVYINDYWNLQADYKPINDTTPKLNLSLTYQPMSLFKWQMYAAQGMRKNWYSFLGEDMMEESDEEQDSLKTTLLDTNPYLLGLTIVVSIVHSVFEFLAFKNDIQFWKNQKTLEGLSVRSVFFNTFQSLIVLLYVLDNDTNLVIRISVFVGLGIEIWKIHKVMDIKLDRENKIFGVIPTPRFKDKGTYVQSHTKEYDQMAFRYLSWLLYPLLVAYAVYSVLYVEHKGWYSWVLSLLYGFLLTFGFIMMTPQLFINYKLKSVAHLPWRMLTYKALNTFIDDLFAFVIKMPTLYRLGCFRDDIVFLIYVYQRYIYPVDHKRVNEFGTSGEMHGEGANGEAITENNAEANSGEGTQSAIKSEAEKKKD